jgi:hypothetical protein
MSKSTRLILLTAALAGCTLDDLLGGVTTVNGGTGAACRQDANCRPGLHCVAGKCAATGDKSAGSTCFISDECGAGLVCGIQSKCEAAGDAAAGDTCDSPTACEKGLYCKLQGTNGICTASGAGDIDGACTSTSDCLGGLYCAGGKCSHIVQVIDRIPEETCAASGALEGAFRPYFEVPRGGARLPDFYRLPYPNDIRKKNGKISISDHPTPGGDLVGIDVVKMYLDRSGDDLDGFGTSSGVYFRFSGPIQFSTVTASGQNASLQWIDLSNDTPRGLQYLWDPNRGRYICHNRLVIRPLAGDPLKAATTYAVILTTAIQDPNGTSLTQDADFAAMVSSTAPTDADLLAAYNAYAPLRAYLTRKSISPSTIAAAALFTTQDPLSPMNKLRAAVYAAPAPTPLQPTLCNSGVTSPCAGGGEGSDAIRACGPANAAFHEVHFKASIPIFQHGTPPYETPDDGGDIRLDGSGNPTRARMEEVCFALTVPKGASMPTAGWPLVIYTHGTGGNFRSHVDDGTAQNFTAASPGTGNPVNFAVLGLDLIEHGPRRGSSTRKPDHLVYNFLNPRGARDNFLQGSADFHSAVRLAKSLALGAGVTGQAVTIDPNHIYFEGHSQGATHAPMFLAYEPDVRASILSGAGALLIESLLGKHSPIDIARAMQLAMAELQTVDEFHPILNIFQAFFERSDPINFGKLITGATPARHVFQTYGVGDTFTPVKTMQNLGLAMGLDLANPVLEDFSGITKINLPVKGNRKNGTQTAVMMQFQPGNYDGHFVIFNESNAERRAAAWFATAYQDANGVPTLIQ